MTRTNVNMLKLQQAIRQFGSLQTTMEAVEGKKKAFETEISVLANELEVMKKNEAQGLDNIKRIERTFEERKQGLRELENAFEKYKQDVDEFMTNNKKSMLQYYMVESLVAMLCTSPSEKESIKELAINIQIMGEAVWKFSQQPLKLRWLFVHTVLGEHLHCYCCDRCGLKFIANQEVQSHTLGYHCPNCGFMSSMKADDSFLEAMLSSGEPADANETQEQEE